MTTQRLTAAAALHLGIPMTESIDAKVAQPAQAELKSWRDVTDAELESLVDHWGTDSRQACLDLAALLKHKNPSHYILLSTKPVQSSELRVCPRHDYAIADENGCTYCNDEKADKPTPPLQGAKDAFHTLREAAYAVLSNEEHAFSGGMRSYQKGSDTWQVYEDLRIAAIASQKGAI